MVTIPMSAVRIPPQSPLIHPSTAFPVLYLELHHENVVLVGRAWPLSNVQTWVGMLAA